MKTQYNEHREQVTTYQNKLSPPCKEAHGADSREYYLNNSAHSSQIALRVDFKN